MTRHNSNLAGARFDDSRAVGTKKTALGLAPKGIADFDHVVLRNALSDAYNQRNFVFHSLEQRRSGSGRRNEHNGGIRVNGLLSLNTLISGFYF